MCISNKLLNNVVMKIDELKTAEFAAENMVGKYYLAKVRLWGTMVGGVHSIVVISLNIKVGAQK